MKPFAGILLIDTTGRGHLVNPRLVSSVSCTGGTTGKNAEAVVQVSMAGGEKILVTGFGSEEAEALDNVALAINGEAHV